MDTFTDLLSTIFVSSSNRKKHGSSKQVQEKTNKKDTETQTMSNFVIEAKETQTYVEETQTLLDTKEDSAPTLTSNVVETAVEEETAKGTVEKVEEETAKGIVEKVEEETAKGIVEKVEEETANDVNLATSVCPHNVIENDNGDQDVKSEERSFTDSILSDDRSEQENNITIKKYVLKASEIYKRDIFLNNKELKDSIYILSDILHSLSLMKNVADIYTNKVYILSTQEHKKMYKKMLLDNPYLFFSNFVVQSRFHSSDASTFDSELRKLLICDIKMFEKVNVALSSIPNLHIIVVSCDYDTYAKDIYNTLNKKTLLIHKKEHLKNQEKSFYKHVLTGVANIQYTFDRYYDMVNDEDIGLRNIIIRERELRYN
uniref:Uncharacterized protein n=1 Tax=viral metagenome TaxID=1070528 RepID=A0A6C0DZK4_9ZZZZ